MSSMRVSASLLRSARVAVRPALRAAATPMAVRAPLAMRSFASSVAVRGPGETDGKLSEVLGSELQFEKDDAAANSRPLDEEPQFVKDLKAAGTWTLAEAVGEDEVTLTRSFGNENIRLMFSAGEYDNSAALVNQEAAEDEDPESISVPVRCTITITKAGKGALTADVQAIDGQFDVEGVSYYPDEKLASDLTVEADWARRGTYVGPQFETLDDKVQDEFSAYLEERGFTSELAMVVPALAEWKEQREYTNWLENVKKFVEA